MFHRYVFIVGGVMSSVGKGITAASLGTILLAKGYKITNVKCEMYVNIDAGTIRPTEHGEVFVCDDGIETDQDIGSYERFTNQNLGRENFLTTGQIYQEVIKQERNLEFAGEDVEVVPHIPNEIIRRIKLAAKKHQAEITIVELGGTVGEYQVLLFLEAARLMKLAEPNNVQFCLVSYLPIPKMVGEMKTKPTQYAVQTLNHAGIQPDFIVCRAEKPIDQKRKDKLAMFCSVAPDNIIAAPDAASVYLVPGILDRQRLGEKVLKRFNLKRRQNNFRAWKKMVGSLNTAKKRVRIGIVGKYFATGDFTLADSYISVIEAIKHAGAALNLQPEIDWINAEEIEKKGIRSLRALNGIIIPQGWGSRGALGKIMAIKYAREKKVPYLGLCYGMQMAVVEFARNVLKFKSANSEEVDAKTPYPVIHIMPEQQKLIAKKLYGGTIRLGAWPCKVIAGTRLATIYKNKKISERHRHRYEFNNEYRPQFAKAGLTIAGTSPDGKLVEAVEITNHPFFVGTQFHPEYKSKPLQPHPVFVEFLRAGAQLKK